MWPRSDRWTLTKQDWQQRSQSKHKEPQGWGRRPYGTNAPQLAGGDSRVEKQPSFIPLLQQEEGKCRDSAVDQMPDKGREQRRCRARPPVAGSSENQSPNRQRTNLPPDHAKQKPPRDTESKARGLVAE